MKESERLADQYERLYNGQSWIDVTIEGTLNGLTAKQAAAKPFSHANSIWQIVHHLVNWRETVLKRIKGDDIPAPDNNFFVPVIDSSDEAWKKLMHRFESSQQEWMEATSNLSEENLDSIWQPGQQSIYELVLGILQHDAYHLGQIVLLKKFV